MASDTVYVHKQSEPAYPIEDDPRMVSGSQTASAGMLEQTASAHRRSEHNVNSVKAASVIILSASALHESRT